MLLDKHGNVLNNYDLVEYLNYQYIFIPMEDGIYLFNDLELVKIDEPTLGEVELIEPFLGDWL